MFLTEQGYGYLIRDEAELCAPEPMRETG
jgi:hypothetical protein